MASPSPHWLSLTRSAPTLQSDLGSIQIVDETALPILNRLSVKRSMYSLRISENGMREPHRQPVTAEPVR
ncbi:cupin domain-containing protein [Streptomyces sp. NPDC055092]